MRKLSETPMKSSSPTLVLFDDVLDPQKVLQSPEVEKIVSFFYGKPTLSVTQAENPETLRVHFQDEQYKADVLNRAMTYPFKANFEDLTLPTYSNQYCGPLYVQMFSTEATDYDVLTITCHWGDGLFLNDYYVVGAIADAEDWKKIVEITKKPQIVH